MTDHEGLRCPHEKLENSILHVGSRGQVQGAMKGKGNGEMSFLLIRMNEALEETCWGAWVMTGGGETEPSGHVA